MKKLLIRLALMPLMTLAGEMTATGMAPRGIVLLFDCAANA